MESVSLSEFKKAKGSDLKNSESVHLTVDGDYIGSFIIPAGEGDKDQLEILMELSNNTYNRDGVKNIFGGSDGEED